MTTAEWFAEALSRCGEGKHIPLPNIIEIMHRLGWTTKSPTRRKILDNVHSRVYKQMRHAETHPAEALPIDYGKSRYGLYAYKPKRRKK